jgi:hypothetical protein
MRGPPPSGSMMQSAPISKSASGTPTSRQWSSQLAKPVWGACGARDGLVDYLLNPCGVVELTARLLQEPHGGWGHDHPTRAA